MTEAEKILRDIKTLRDSIELNKADLANLPMSPETRAGILKHIAWCYQELQGLGTGNA